MSGNSKKIVLAVLPTMIIFSKYFEPLYPHRLDMRKALFLSCYCVCSFLGCSKKGEQGDTNVPPKIRINTVFPPTINYDGTQNPQDKAIITFTATGKPIPTVTVDNRVVTNLYTTPSLLTSRTFQFIAINNVGSDQASISVPVIIDPVVALLSKDGWIMCQKIIDGIPYQMLCDKDDTTQFSVNGTFYVRFGGDCSAGYPGLRTWYLTEGKTKIQGWIEGGLKIEYLSADSLRVSGYSGSPTGPIPMELSFRH
jgi:hypothetical protein